MTSEEVTFRQALAHAATRKIVRESAEFGETRVEFADGSALVFASEVQQFDSGANIEPPTVRLETPG